MPSFDLVLQITLMVITSSETDFTTSIEKSLAEIDPRYKELYGVIVTGSHKPLDVEKKIELIRMAREHHIPFLGICMGMQLCLIEFARNVLGYPNANSTEIDPACEPKIIIKLPKLRVGQFNVSGRNESHWHHYAFSNKYVMPFKEWDLVFSDGILEKISLPHHIHYKGVQYHPEYQSSNNNLHPDLVDFISACKQYANLRKTRKP